MLLGAAIEFLDVEFADGIALFLVVELLGALTALGIGIVLSLFAENEFQAIQFIPVVITRSHSRSTRVQQLQWYAPSQNGQ